MHEIKIRPKQDTESFLCYSPVQSKYKFEQGGMLVYDIKADTIKSSNFSMQLAPTISIQKPKLNQPSQLNYENIPDTSIEIYEKIKEMPAAPSFPSTYVLQIPDDNLTLTFNSKFESGNLSKAIKLSDYEYNLIIRSDFHSEGNNHWYYFSVQNPRKTSVTFHIQNMKKHDVLYKSGMKPAVLSIKHKNTTGTSWHRDGNSISYKPNTSNDYFTLTFTYNFRYEEDTVYFAYSYPYTFSDLSEYLNQISANYSAIARIDKLCYSLVGNPCEVLTITEKISSFYNNEEEVSDLKLSAAGRKLKKRKTKQNNDHKGKKGIVLTGRVHSGETVASFMLKGSIDFLLSDCKKAKILRKNFVFKIIPMLNPDGVRYGNYRCSLLGVDLNRQWHSPNKFLHPTIFHAKKMMQVFNENHKILFFCDFHGHTRKKNVFMYGCSDSTNDFFVKRKNHCAKIFPILMEQNPFFSFSSCHFRMENYKASTARIVMYKEFGINFSYTIEASFFGPDSVSAFGAEGSDDLQMNELHLESVGKTLCSNFSIFLSENTFYSKVLYANAYLANKQGFLQKNIKEDNSQLSKETVWDNINLETDEESEDSGGSDSYSDDKTIKTFAKRSRSFVKSRKISQKRYDSCLHSEQKIQNIRKPDETHENLKNRFRVSTKLENLKRKIIVMRKNSKQSLSPSIPLSPLSSLQKGNIQLFFNPGKEKLIKPNELPKLSNKPVKAEYLPKNIKNDNSIVFGLSLIK